MPKKFRIGNSILAEYVTRGDRNKHMLVNVYSGDVIVPSFPADLGFGFYIDLLRPDPEALPDQFTMEFSYGGNPILRGQGSGGDPPESPIVTFTVPHIQFVAQEPGQIELTLSAPGFQKTTALSKRVLLGEVR